MPPIRSVTVCRYGNLIRKRKLTLPGLQQLGRTRGTNWYRGKERTTRITPTSTIWTCVYRSGVHVVRRVQIISRGLSAPGLTLSSSDQPNGANVHVCVESDMRIHFFYVRSGILNLVYMRPSALSVMGGFPLLYSLTSCTCCMFCDYTERYSAVNSLKGGALDWQ